MNNEILPFFDINQILDLDEPVYAHTGSHSTCETLQDHTSLCQKFFVQIYAYKQIDNVLDRFVQYFPEDDKALLKSWLKLMLCNLVVFHDMGKINPLFQKNKMHHSIDGEILQGVSGSSHSQLSAVIYLDYFFNNIKQASIKSTRTRNLLISLVVEHAYLIARHHSYLNSLVTFVQDIYIDVTHQTHAPINDLFCELKNGKVSKLRQWYTADEREWSRNLKKWKTDTNSYDLSIAKQFYYRLAYSLLVMCDYYATYAYESDIELPIIPNVDFQKYVRAYENGNLTKTIKVYKKTNYHGEDKSAIDQTKHINDLRSEIYLDVMAQFDQHKDMQLFFLEAPTGSGKSNIALGLSMKMIENKQKIFYIYPFNTLVEQNRKTLHSYFNDAISNLNEELVVINSLTPIQIKADEELTSVDYEKALFNREFLNYPFILSTHVSFFDLFFGCSKSSTMAFYQLLNSVVVLDEIQNYRNIIWSELILSLKICADLFNMKVIIMSATLPNLETFLEESAKNQIAYLLPNANYYYQHALFKNRVQLDYHLLNKEITLSDLYDSVVACQGENKKILIEFITKKDAEEFFSMLKSSEEVYMPVQCLTGDDSLYQRESIIAPIRDKQCFSIILVATQVIEAGVDIDMDVGFKNISTLDGEEQFLGRINRSCHNDDSKVYFFKLSDVRKVYRQDYRVNTSFTLINEKCRDLLINKDFHTYYNGVLKLIKQRNNELNGNGLIVYMADVVSKLDYPKIQERMRLIEENQYTIDVFFNRQIIIDGKSVCGKDVWTQYKNLICDENIDYSQKKVRLSEVRAQMNYFIQRINKDFSINYTDSFGDLFYVEDGEQYFINGRFDRQILIEQEKFI